MTPQDKAKDLFNKAIYKLQMADKYGYLLKDDEKYLAKLIVTDTVIEMLLIHGSSLHQDFWKEVQKELESF